MKFRVSNISKGRRGVEKAGGGYVWLDPGQTKPIEVANPKDLQRDPSLDAKPMAELAAPPTSLRVKLDSSGLKPLPPADDTEKVAPADGIAKTKVAAPAKRRHRGRRKAAAK